MKSPLYISYLKAPLDILVASILLIVLLPFIIFLTTVLLLVYGGNPFFVQRRTGLGGKDFDMYKFRSFRRNGDYTSIDSFGKILRATSIDELPQLLNILIGNMSFVGPRPLLPEYKLHYSEEESQRHVVKPGLTGYTQVHLGNSSNWGKRMQRDIYYIHNISFYLDIKIVAFTIAGIFNFAEKAKADVEIQRFDEYAQNR